MSEILQLCKILFIRAHRLNAVELTFMKKPSEEVFGRLGLFLSSCLPFRSLGTESLSLEVTQESDFFFENQIDLRTNWKS